MKKVWIASIFATLMLLVPLTSVVGANEVEDCNCNPISDIQVVRIERLLDRIESRINFILLRHGHIPEVAEKCKEILEIINLEDIKNIFCDTLEGIIDYLIALGKLIPIELWAIIFGIPWLLLVALYLEFCQVFP